MTGPPHQAFSQSGPLSEPSANLDRSQCLQFGWTVLRAFGLTGTPTGLQSIRTAQLAFNIPGYPPGNPPMHTVLAL